MTISQQYEQIVAAKVTGFLFIKCVDKSKLQLEMMKLRARNRQASAPNNSLLLSKTRQNYSFALNW